MGLCTWPPDATTAVVENARQNLKKTAPIVTKFIDALDRQKLIRFVALLVAAAGPKVIVQERRAVGGGDRGIPSGFRNSVAAYTVSLLNSTIIGNYGNSSALSNQTPEPPALPGVVTPL